MALQLESALAGAALNERERHVVLGIVAGLRAELREDLLAVWLYGSRARGAVDPAEADPDLRSDVDLMAIVDPARDAAAVSWEIAPLLEGIADAAGDSPVYYSLRIYDAEHLRDRRRIRSFFFQEVDRDKLVLYGGSLPEPVPVSRQAARARVRRSSWTRRGTPDNRSRSPRLRPPRGRGQCRLLNLDALRCARRALRG